MRETVLIVEDETDLRLILRNNLSFVGYRVLEAGDGNEGLAAIFRERPDLVLLDLRLPGKDGLTVLREVRGRGLLVPVLVLTARAEEADRVRGFELGADDYVTKPFSVAELLARVKAILRRTRGIAASGPLRFGDLAIDLDKYTIERGGRRATLGYFEAEILRVLLKRPGEPVSRKELLDEVWGADACPTPRVVDNHILSLRKKVELDPKDPRTIQTAHRVGYRFAPGGVTGEPIGACALAGMQPLGLLLEPEPEPNAGESGMGAGSGSGSKDGDPVDSYPHGMMGS